MAIPIDRPQGAESATTKSNRRVPAGCLSSFHGRSFFRVRRIGFRCSLCPRWAILQDRISPPTSGSDVACDMTSRLRGSWPLVAGAGQANPVAPHAPSPAPAGSGEPSRCAPCALAGHRFRWSRQARCSLRHQHPDPRAPSHCPAAASRLRRPAAAPGVGRERTVVGGRKSFPAGGVAAC